MVTNNFIIYFKINAKGGVSYHNIKSKNWREKPGDKTIWLYSNFRGANNIKGLPILIDF